MTMNIEIKSINNAKDFVEITTKYPFEEIKVFKSK